MSGTAPTPGMFGSDEAAEAQNPRTSDQMQRGNAQNWWGGTDAAQDSGRASLGGYAQGWWGEAPEQTTLATTTGQNLSGTENAFSNEWWDSAAAQDKEQTTQLGRWTREGANGIATYSYGQDGNVPAGMQGERVRFGDVFVGGKNVGNVYEGYGGMTSTDADEIMARLVLPREVWAAAYETEAGRPLTFTGSLSEEIQREAQKQTENFAKGLTAAAFEQGVAERAESFEGGAGQLGTTAAAMGVGAAWGAGIGSLVPVLGTAAGAITGALLGGLGAYINRDEQFRMYAQALEQMDMAIEDGHTAVGYADAAAGFGGAAMQQMNVSRNLLHGAYDALSEGGAGDQSSAYQDTDTSGVMELLDFLALGVDGVGSFGSAGARRVFALTMGGSSIGTSGSVIAGAFEGGEAFNPYSGDYEQLSAWGQTQRAASALIDIGQTAAVGRLSRYIERTAGRQGGTAMGGFVLRTDAKGVTSAVRPGFSALIPSEAAVGITARMFARRSVRNLGLAATRENMAIQTARHLELLTTGRKTIATAVVNGFGEGAEEFVQAVLGATAFGETPTFREVVDAAKQGFAMGAGMGVAIGRGAMTRDKAMRKAADEVRTFIGWKPYTDAEWGGLTDSERAIEGTKDVEEAKQLLTQWTREAENLAGPVAAANFVELRRMQEAAVQLAEQGGAHSQPTAETSKLSLRSNFDWGPQDYVVSATAARRDMQARVDLLTRVSQGEVQLDRDGNAISLTPEQLVMVQRILQSDTQMLQGLVALDDATEKLLADPTAEAIAKVETKIDKMNKEIQRAWYAKDVDEKGVEDPSAFGARRSAAVWGARFPLNSSGSFQLLRLQISPELTMSARNNAAMLPDEVQDAIGGDFDGDRFVHMLRQLLPESTFLELKHGAGLLTADGVMMRARKFTKVYVRAMRDARNDPGSDADAAAKVASRNISSRLYAILSQTSIPEAQWKALVGTLVHGLESNSPAEIGKFHDKLSTKHAVAMRQLGEALGDSPWFRMNRIIEEELRTFQDTLALRKNTRDISPAIDLPLASDSMPRRTPKEIAAPSGIMDAAVKGAKYAIFRLEQVLKYNAYREPIPTTLEERTDALWRAYQTFAARNDGIVRPGEQALFETTLAQDRVIDWLGQLADEYRQNFPGLTKYEAMVLLAGAKVDDLDVVNQRKPRSSKEIRLLQSLLREVVTGLRAEYSEVMSDPAIAQRMNALDALTNPDYMKGDKDTAQGGDAFVEVMGSFPVTLLLGQQSAAITSGLTVRQLRDKIIDMRWDRREAYVEALENHPSYKTQDGEATSAYRTLIEMVVESARMNLSEDRVNGHVSGSRTRSSRAASDNFISLHDTLQKLADAKGLPRQTAEDYRTLLERTPQLAEQVLKLVEARGIRAAVTRSPEGDLMKVKFPMWVYEVLAEKQSKRAEQMLLDMTLTFAKVGLQTLDDQGNPADELDVYRVQDRILRLWLDLEYQASRPGIGSVHAAATLADFHTLRTTSTSTDAFIGALNTDWRFRSEASAPYIAWSRDRSIVEADRFGRGVSDVQEGVEMRDALRDAAKAAAAALGQEQALQEYVPDNTDLIDRLRESAEGKGDKELWRRFEAWFNLAKDLPTMIAASIWIQQAGHINEILSGMAVKGMSPENVAALGKAIAAQLPSFDAAVGRLLSSMTSGSMYEVMMDMTSLARSGRTIVMDDGTVVEWAALDARGALDLLSNKRTAGLASRMMGLTAWDYNDESGTNSLVSVAGKGIVGFTSTIEDALWGSDTMSQFRRLMILEGMSTTPGGTPIMPVLLAQRVNIREVGSSHVIGEAETVNGTERERIATEELTRLADVLDKLSRVNATSAEGARLRVIDDGEDGTGIEMPLMNRVLVRAGRKARMRHGVGNPITRMLASQPELVRDYMYNELVMDQVIQATAAEVADNELLRLKAAKLKQQLETSRTVASPLDLLLSTYGSYTEAGTQTMLRAYAEANGDLAIGAVWAENEIRRMADPKKEMLAEDWHMVARAVIAHSLNVNSGISSRSEVRISLFPPLNDADALAAERAAWDPTFVELGLDVFATNVMNDVLAKPTPIMESAIALFRMMQPKGLPDVTPEQAEQAVLSLISPQNEDGGSELGEWHALFPALVHAATGAAIASSAEAGIKMAGINPERLRMLIATTKQDWSRKPYTDPTAPDPELSTVEFPAAQLIAAVSQGSTLTSMVDMQIAGRTAPASRPLIQLDGKVVRDITVTLPDGSTVKLMKDPRWATGLMLPSETGIPVTEAGVVVIDTLSATVQTLLAEQRVPQRLWNSATIAVSFYHPDTKTVSTTRRAGANYDHNPWFDGVASATDAAFPQRSLLGQFYFGLGGMIGGAYSTAMDATKTLTSALQQVTTLPEIHRQWIMRRGLDDMAGMLSTIADFATRQKIDGRKQSRRNYTAYYKLLSLLYVVRYVDADGAHVLSAEDVIARQMRNETFGPENHAEVVGLPLHHVLMLMGEMNLAAYGIAITPNTDRLWSLEVSTVPEYSSFPAEAWTENMLGGLISVVPDENGNFASWDTRELTEEPKLLNLTIPRSSVGSRNGINPRARKKMWEQWRKIQGERAADRRDVRGAQTVWSEQETRMRKLGGANENVMLQAGKAAQLVAEGRSAEASRVTPPRKIKTAPTNDMRTGWLYQHRGEKQGGKVQGVLRSPEEILENTMLDDFVIIPASTFYIGMDQDINDLLPMAYKVIDAMYENGTTIELPVDEIYGGELRHAMAAYARQNGFVETNFNSGTFVPIEHEDKTQARAALESTLSVVRASSAINRALIDISPDNAQFDGSASEANGGIDMLGSVDIRDIVQTARYPHYGPLALTESNQRAEAIALLLKIVNSKASLAYLRKQSGISKGDVEAGRAFDDAIKEFKIRLALARDDTDLDLNPPIGMRDFGLGTILPLGEYNEEGQLVGLHLVRHGHLPVEEFTLRGPALPEGNAALSTNGVRLTIDKGEPDVLHTAYTGRLIRLEWRGLQGMIAHLRVSVASLASKLTVIGAGLKLTIAPAPSNQLIPSRNIFSNMPVLIAADAASPDSKTSDEHLNVTSRIIESVGFDVMPFFVRKFYGITRDGTNNKEYDNAVLELEASLRKFSMRHGGEATPAEAVARNTDGYDIAMRSEVQRAWNELFEKLSLSLDDLSTDEAIVDNTMIGMVLTALTTGAPVDTVLRAPGFVGRPVGSLSHTMHPVFTTLMDQLPWNHKARIEFVNRINQRMMPPDAEEGYELNPDYSWTRHVIDKKGVRGEVGARYEIPAMLAYKTIRITGANDDLSEMAQERQNKGSISPTTQAMVYSSANGSAMIEKALRNGSQILEEQPMLHSGEVGQKRFFFGSRPNKSPFGPRADTDLRRTAAEQEHLNTRAIPARAALKPDIDMSGWHTDVSKADKLRREGAFSKLLGETLLAYNLTRPGDRQLMFELLRSVMARPAAAPGSPEKMTYADAMAGLALIKSNANKHVLPGKGGAVGVPTRAMMWRLKEAGHVFWAGDGSRKPLKIWDEYVELMLSEAFSDDPQMRGYPAVTNIIDGIMHEYEADVKGLPATINDRLAPIFTLARTPSGMLVSSPHIRNDLRSPPVQGGKPLGSVRELSDGDWMLDELPQSARDIIEKRMAAWEGRQGIGRKRQSPRAEARQGIHIRNTLARTNVLLRYIVLGYVLKTLLNPGLFISAFFELAIRGGQENVTSFLAGENLGAQGFTPEQIRMWNNTIKSLAGSEKFYALIYRNTNYQQIQGADSRIEKTLETWSNRTAGAFNDPTWMTQSPILARTFLEAAWYTANRYTGDRVIPVEQFLESAGVDVESLASIDPLAVAAGFARVEYRRNMQDNLAARLARNVTENVINSGRVGNVLGTLLLRLPLMFVRFRSNTLINMFGMQAPHAALTQLLSDRTKRPGGFKDHILGVDTGLDVEITAQARIEDSYDLTRAIIRSGVSHTQLLVLGSVLSSQGFGGDDEEEKLLNKLRRYQRTYVAQDPMSLENDFRNAQAWFAALLPAGMGVPSWIIRPFVSPAMGVARFFETGDYRQVMYGFADALGNMPLLNVDTVLNSWALANDLVSAAEAESMSENLESTAEASKLLWTATGVLEGMLFESAFASMVYQAADEYDRDPFLIPDISRDGVPQVDRMGNPLPTPALDDFINDDGESQQGYQKRNTVDAYLHSLGENRPVFAWLASKVMSDSSFIRTNMVPKTREFDAAEPTTEEAAQIVMSIYNNEMGSEELTIDGAAGVIRGLHLGTISLDSASINGIFITEDMRWELTDMFLEQATAKYVEAGFGKGEALNLAKEEYYGQAYGEPEALGLADIIWSDAIPKYQTQKYYQLNTTYIMGPGGYPIATGMQRSILAGLGLNPEGLGVFETFHAGDTGNLEIDDLLNSVDSVRGVNLGQRGMMKVDESWIPPTPEELADRIEESLDKIAGKLDDINDAIGDYSGSGGYGGYGGGGYTSRADYGGQAQRLNTPRGIGTPYALDGRVVNPGNPIIRRATIRRERFSSDRGRLNQWQ